MTCFRPAAVCIIKLITFHKKIIIITITLVIPCTIHIIPGATYFYFIPFMVGTRHHRRIDSWAIAHHCKWLGISGTDSLIRTENAVHRLWIFCTLRCKIAIHKSLIIIHFFTDQIMYLFNLFIIFTALIDLLLPGIHLFLYFFRLFHPVCTVFKRRINTEYQRNCIIWIWNCINCRIQKIILWIWIPKHQQYIFLLCLRKCASRNCLHPICPRLCRHSIRFRRQVLFTDDI